jgi:formate--tetrahydrofolate ligase
MSSNRPIRSPRPIAEVARGLGIQPGHLIAYGDDKAKVRLAALDSGRERGKLILVSALTPTSAGEGKTTVSIGLAQGLAAIGERAALALREPSLGPTFGVKGGATGGGKSIVVPAEDINLHFTGDFHAITSANNLLAAILDNHLHQGNALGIEPRRVLWRRVIDLNDRALRDIVIGLGGPSEGVIRETGFDITPASEIMATLCLAEGEDDLRARLGRLIVALRADGSPVTAADLKAVGALLILLKDALLPNLVQSIEGVPAFIHGGPFANIAHGCNSVLATKMALAHADWTVTEAGFGADLGAEKFLDIKARYAGLDVAAVKRLAEAEGVVAVNTEIFARGGDGGTDLARAVIAEAAKAKAPYTPLYDWALPMKKKIETIATKVYGARSVAYAKIAERDLRQIDQLGYGGLPVCVAKTQNSLSDDAALAGRPRDFDVTVRRVVLSAGPGFVVPLLGEIIRMPGLPPSPQSEKMDWVGGKVVGLLGG